MKNIPIIIPVIIANGDLLMSKNIYKFIEQHHEKTNV